MASLVTLNEYKDYADIVSDDQDTRIKAVILYVSDFVKQYCNRTFIDNYDTVGSQFTPIVEYWNGGSCFYNTKEYPIQSVTSVELSPDLGQTYTALAAGTDYAHDLSKDRIYVVEGDLYDDVNSYRITYTGGYSALPDSLKVAVLDLIDYYIKQESTPKRVQNFVSVEYVKTSDLPHHIKRVLDLFRNIEG